MKIVMISDTHGGHEALGTLSGDVLIHCGDIANLFEPDDHAIEKIDHWFSHQAFDHILCIGGNHDLTLEHRMQTDVQPIETAVFLHDTEVVIDGVKFYGSSWVPKLSQHAFFANDETLQDAWSKIPDDVDVLITHTPPAGILDVSSRGLSLGCRHLVKRLGAIRPSLHCFGHVHASAGSITQNGTTFINASSVDSNFEIAHQPFEYDLAKQTPRKRERLWKSLFPVRR